MTKGLFGVRVQWYDGTMVCSMARVSRSGGCPKLSQVQFLCLTLTQPCKAGNETKFFSQPRKVLCNSLYTISSLLVEKHISMHAERVAGKASRVG